MDNSPREPRRGLPSRRLTATLAAGMLALGVGVGAAIGPTPETSQAGDAATLAARLPLLIRALSAQAPGSGSMPAGGSEEAASEELLPRHRRRRRRRAAAAPAATEPPPAGSEAAPEGAGGGRAPAGAPTGAGATRLPAVTDVWLIELDGGGFAQAAAQPGAAPYLHATVLPAATLLSGASAVDGQVLAADATAAAKTPVGANPPLLHTIVQPPCPEGSTACAPETPGQLTAADQFLQATLAQITGTAAYREHGLVVITFANVAVPTESGLPAGSSSATLTTQPPAGVALMSPFARAGSHPSTKFNPASPVRTLEGLLHR